MKTKIYIPDIECESCTKLLSKKFNSITGVNSFVFSKDSAEIDYDNSVKKEALIKVIKENGFRASEEPFERKTLQERFRELKENKKKNSIEISALKYAAASFFIIILIETIAYFGFFRTIPNFLSKYIWWLFYLNITISTLGASLWHFFAYKTKVTCMLGMMVGMAFGMQTGMMIGAVIGATNGFFIGAMTGMIIGVIAGILTGKCCGVMGIMQGMMAGIMGGTMGPMISLMMFSDNILLFMPFYMLINVAIMAGYIYMMFEEAVEGKDVKKAPLDFLTFVSASIIISAAFIVLMLYGPKSFLVR
jgi:copper chaperone CopZ